MNDGAYVAVGTVIYRAGAYILDRYLDNQREIQSRYSASELILATNEHDFAGGLEELLSSRGIRGKVLRYATNKPDYARSRVWNIVCGREAIREYLLSQTAADYILWLDADMIYDPDVITIMERELQGYDVVYSGARVRGSIGIALTGGGCCMATRDVLGEVNFRCLEYENGFAMHDDTLFEYDLIRLGKKIKKGYFLTISHFENEDYAVSIEPHRVSLYRRITFSKLVRYILIRATIALKYDIGGWWLNGFIYRLLYRAVPGL